jgi:hypothetical protein
MENSRILKLKEWRTWPLPQQCRFLGTLIGMLSGIGTTVFFWMMGCLNIAPNVAFLNLMERIWERYIALPAKIIGEDIYSPEYLTFRMIFAVVLTNTFVWGVIGRILGVLISYLVLWFRFRKEPTSSVPTSEPASHRISTIRKFSLRGMWICILAASMLSPLPWLFDLGFGIMFWLVFVGSPAILIYRAFGWRGNPPYFPNGMLFLLLVVNPLLWGGLGYLIGYLYARVLIALNNLKKS